MDVEVIPAASRDQAIIGNLFELYLHDLSEFSSAIEISEEGRFLLKGALDVWWEREALLPFLIRVDGSLAGFALVCKPPHVSPGREYRLNEFFLLKCYRRKGAGQQAACTLFRQFPGAWEMGWLPQNTPAATFWQKTVAAYTGGNYSQALVMESQEQGLPGLHFDAGSEP